MKSTGKKVFTHLRIFSLSRLVRNLQ